MAESEPVAPPRLRGVGCGARRRRAEGGSPVAPGDIWAAQQTARAARASEPRRGESDRPKESLPRCHVLSVAAYIGAGRKIKLEPKLIYQYLKRRGLSSPLGGGALEYLADLAQQVARGKRLLYQPEIGVLRSGQTGRHIGISRHHDEADAG